MHGKGAGHPSPIAFPVADIHPLPSATTLRAAITLDEATTATGI